MEGQFGGQGQGKRVGTNWPDSQIGQSVDLLTELDSNLNKLGVQVTWNYGLGI